MNKWYERIKYPDNQISAKMITGQPITALITERINSYEDLMFIRSIVDMVDGNTLNTMWLTIPCLFGQRSDRRFSPNQSFDLKLIAEVINSCNFRSVEIFDPHSYVSLALINNSRKIPPDEYVEKTLQNIDYGRGGETVLVSPDAGAYKKLFGLGEKFDLPVVAANKYRDMKGNISLTFVGDVKDKTCLIVDDLADGAFTFYLLGKALKEQGAKRVYLYVSHAYFTQGYDKLKEVLDGIYCTNSVKDIDNEFVTQYKFV